MIRMSKSIKGCKEHKNARPEARLELIKTQGVGLVGIKMLKSLSDESRHTSIECIMVARLLVFDAFPQTFECGDRNVGRRFKGTLVERHSVKQADDAKKLHYQKSKPTLLPA